MQATDFHPQKVFCCPYLLNVINNIYESGFRSLIETLSYLHMLEKFPINAIYCVRINKKDLMIICEQHLKVAVIGSFSYSGSINQQTDFVIELQEKQKHLCKRCVRHYCGKMSVCFNFVIFNSN